MVSHSRASLGAHHLRALNLPQPITVQADDQGQPLAVQLGSSWIAVVAVQDRWRIDEAWWRQEIVRLYSLLLLEDGRLVTVFHDLTHHQWYQQVYS